MSLVHQLIIAAVALGSMCCASSALAAEKPNIVYILADDMGYGDVAAFNPQSKIPTPNIDRLAAEGMKFTDAHTASAVCTPTRYGLLTGRYAWRSRLKRGVLGGYSPRLIEEGRPTVASLLKSQGYHAACIGKWHLGMDWPTDDDVQFGDSVDPAGDVTRIDFERPIRNGPNAVGFDEFFGISASLDMPPYIFIENDRTVGLPTARKKWLREGQAEPSFEAQDVLRTLAERSQRYIRERAKTGEPFFLYLPLNSPHTPVVPRPEMAGRGKIGDYGDFVYETDWAVGQVLETLRETGLEENTLVIFTADNGYSPSGMSRAAQREAGHNSSHIFRGAKADIWEGGHRVPFVARWPGRVAAGSTCDSPICLNSLMATCADILSLELPQDAGEDSFSILPLLEGATRVEQPAIVHHSIAGMFAIRRGPWKLIEGQGSGGWTKGAVGEELPPAQLYHMEQDPSEQSNVLEQHPEIARELQAELDRIRQSGRSRR